jgi:group I intron endonuclease
MRAAKLGRSHLAETKKKISEALTDLLKGDKNPFFGQTHSQKTKELMSKLRSGVNHLLYGKPVSEKTKELISKRMSEVSASRSFTIYLYSLDLELITIFPSSKKTGKYFESSNTTIMKYVRSGEVFKDKYILSLKELPAK